jgi:four helix bundle protein
MSVGFQDLSLSQQAGQLNIWIYALAQTFPKDDANEFASQLRCASDSVEKNISESTEYRERMSDIEFRKLLGIAQNSMQDLQKQLLAAKQLKMGDEETLRKAEAQCIETSKMLDAFILSLGTSG